MINEQLFHLYASRIQGINALYADLDAKGIKDYAGPLLPYCWEQKYLESKYRLVIFGRETNGWYSDYMNSEEKIWMNVEGHRDRYVSSLFRVNVPVPMIHYESLITMQF